MIDEATKKKYGLLYVDQPLRLFFNGHRLMIVIFFPLLFS